MSVKPFLSTVKQSEEGGEVEVSYVLISTTTVGLCASVGFSLAQTLHQMLVIMSASVTKDNHLVTTSKRGKVVYNAKGERRFGIWNSGLPKRRNPHGNGSAIVGMIPGIVRSIHTEVRKLDNSPKLEARVGQKSLGEMLMFDAEGKCNNAYRILCESSIIQSAYMRIKSEPGNMTPGHDQETLDGISEEWFAKTISDLIKEKFTFKPTRRVFIPKANGKMRPLGIGSPRDKIIQEAFRAILEIVLESKFSDKSHGFRPGRGCHSALAQIRYWNGIK